MVRPLALALLALAALPATTSAHAVLQETRPARGASLERAPNSVQLRFNEPVESRFGAIRVFDSSGKEVQSGAPFHPGGEGRELAVRVGDLADGGYTVTFRVISADAHPVSGGFVFGVGRGAAGAASVDELLTGTSAGPVTATALGAARGVQFAAIALGVGLFLFVMLAWHPAVRALPASAAVAPFERRLKILLRAAASAGMVSAVAAVLLQGATATGESLWSALDPAVVGDVLGTRFGVVWAAAAAVWVVVALGALSAASGLALAALATLPALGGHAGVQSPQALLLPLNVVHAIAISAWLGGIAVLVMAIGSATRALAEPDRTTLLVAAVSRFSALAGVAIAAVLLTGVGQSIVYVEKPANLVETAFGRAVLVKLVLFAAICALGYGNRNRILRLRAAATAVAAGVLLQRVLRTELAVGAAAIGVTAALAGYAPSSAESAGPFATSVPVGPARLEVTVDPARAGPNEMHLYLFSRKDGSQYDATEELRLEASLPDKGIEPIELEPHRTGPGHFSVPAATLGVPGDWTVEVSVRVSDFDAYQAQFEVPVE